MTEHELRVCFDTLKQFILTEKAMRRHVLSEGPDKQRKLKRCDEALQVLVVIKDELKKHVEESPEQVMLFDEPATRRGGY